MFRKYMCEIKVNYYGSVLIERIRNQLQSVARSQCKNAWTYWIDLE